MNIINIDIYLFSIFLLTPVGIERAVFKKGGSSIKALFLLEFLNCGYTEYLERVRLIL
jgi:hypothetical protein